MTNHSALISRLREATGADRELDYAIFDVLHGEWLSKEGYRRDGSGWWSDTPSVKGANSVGPPPFYTALIDEALGLVPEGWTEGELQWWSCQEGPRLAWCKIEGDGPDSLQIIMQRAKTPALAIAICALEARAILAEHKP